MLQGRHDSYPKRRGQTRVPEMRPYGINVAFGQDCCMDPWYSLGSADMLEVAHMGLHVGQMTSRDAMRFLLRHASRPIRQSIMGLDGYGLDVGCNGDLVLLQARDPIEAIRLKATRLAVVRRGKVIAETPARIGRLALDGRPASVDPAAYAPPSLISSTSFPRIVRQHDISLSPFSARCRHRRQREPAHSPASFWPELPQIGPITVLDRDGAFEARARLFRESQVAPHQRPSLKDGRTRRRR